MKLFEMLWLHCIVHAVDHHAIEELVLGNKVLFAAHNVWQDGCAFSRVCGFIFIRMFGQEVLSPVPWLSNRLEDLAAGRSWVVRLSPAAVAFWRDLYAALQALNPYLASHVTGSIMY